MTGSLDQREFLDLLVLLSGTLNNCLLLQKSAFYVKKRKELQYTKRNESQKLSWVKKPDIKEYIWYDSIYWKF